MTLSDILARTIEWGGGTFRYDADADEFFRHDGRGFVVGLTDKQYTARVTDTLGNLANIADVINTHNPAFLGTWVHDGFIYIDPVEVYTDEDTAVAVGRKNNQIAIFNLDTMEEIRL